eukprot:2864028-Karenia_brevis.AAC.1
MRHTKHNVDKYACQASGVDAEPVGSLCTDVHSKRCFQRVTNFRRPLIMQRICVRQGEKCPCLLLCVPM